MPELREYNFTIWKKVIILYKIVLPSIFLGFYIYFFEQLCPFVKLEAFANMLLLIVGLENGIAAFSWLLCEMISIFSILLSIIQYFIMFNWKAEKDINQLCEANQQGFIVEFSSFNDILFIFTAGFNIRIVLPVLAILILISFMTCSFSVILKIFSRNGYLSHQQDLKIVKFKEQQEPTECTICLENLKNGEDACELPCKHWFHYSCLEHWYLTNGTCPNCRQLINEDD